MKMVGHFHAVASQKATQTATGDHAMEKCLSTCEKMIAKWHIRHRHLLRERVPDARDRCASGGNVRGRKCDGRLLSRDGVTGPGKIERVIGPSPESEICARGLSDRAHQRSVRGRIERAWERRSGTVDCVQTKSPGSRGGVRSFYREDVPGVRILSGDRCEQKDHNQQRWQPLMDGFLVLVEGREGAERSDRRCHEFWKGNVLLPRVTNIIVRCVTKRTTKICPNLLSQIGALTWRRLKLRRSGLQVNLNVKGCDIVSDPVYAPSREQKCRPLG
jgi:hypothetical protein